MELKVIRDHRNGYGKPGLKKKGETYSADERTGANLIAGGYAEEIKGKAHAKSGD